MPERADRYSTVSLWLHWGIAALVVTQILLIMAGDAVEGDGARAFRDAHKSVGLSLLVLTLVRIGWRATNPAPALPDTMKTWEKLLARTTHVGFYVALIVLPLSGWLASSAAGRDIAWFGLFNWPLLPIGGGREMAGQFMDIHRAVVKGLYLLLALHVIGALKHHFIDRDGVLRRMLPLIPPRN
jgi:cytochrome b561